VRLKKKEKKFYGIVFDGEEGSWVPTFRRLREMSYLSEMAANM